MQLIHNVFTGNPPMRIIKEGTIRVLPDGDIRAENFEVEGGSLSELQELVTQRVINAAKRLTDSKSSRPRNS